MLTDGRARGATCLRECADVGFCAGQGGQQGEASAITQQGEEFRRQRDLFLGRSVAVGRPYD